MIAAGVAWLLLRSPGHVIYGAWFSDNRKPEVSLCFDAWSSKYSYFHYSRGLTDSYLETGKFRYRRGMIAMRVARSETQFPPKSSGKIPATGIPWPRRPCKSEHPATWCLRIRWLDSRKFRTSDGRVFKRRPPNM